MGSNQTAARFPWAALALSLLASGVGHIYCGRIAKGLVLYSARILLPMLCVIAAFLPPSNGVLLALILFPAAATVMVYLYAPIDAWAIAKRTDPDYKLKGYNRSGWYWLLVTMQLACFVALIVGSREYVFDAFVIPTRSMSPNFLAGDRMLVNKRRLDDGFPEHGDVVVFRAPPSEQGRNWIKRVIGVAGDQVVIRGREIEVNGKQIERERAPNETITQIGFEGDVQRELHGGRRYRILFADDSVDESAMDLISVTVPPRSIFVLGDNRDRSRDSRHIGSINVDDVIGYVDYIYYPAETWSRFGLCQD